jgi:uncharacterized protein (TIGR02246 family)
MKVLRIIVVVILAGCTKQANIPKDAIMSKQSTDIAAIKQLAEDWRSGWIAGDTERVLSLYAEEPVLMPQGQPAISGKENIRPLYEAVMKEVEFESQYKVMDVEVSGYLGYFWCDYTLTATPKAGGETLEVAGKYMCIVKRQDDGSWKITKLMDNSDQTPTGTQ